jgi:hypothetical protein
VTLNISAAEQPLGVGLDGDGRLGQATAPPSGGSRPNDQLERLIKLRDECALTQAEFETQKKWLLS